MNTLAAHSPGEIFFAYCTAIALAVLATMIIGAFAAVIRLRLRDRRLAREADLREAAAIAATRSATATVAPIRIHIPERLRFVAGIDMGEPGGDRLVIATAEVRHGRIVRVSLPASSTPTEARA